MSNKSQINQLSKREILESLLARQQQESSTMNRLVLAVAMAAGLDPETVAKNFADGEGTKSFAETFNKVLDSEFAKRQGASQGESLDAAEQIETTSDTASDSD